MSAAPKLIIAVLATAALLWPRPASAPVAAARAANDSVTVEHEVIHVLPARGAVAAPPRRVNRPNPVRLAANTKAVERPTGMVKRAARMLLGDGRYRPEPFPRPAR